MGNAKERVKMGSGKRKTTIIATSYGFANGRNTGLKNNVYFTNGISEESKGKKWV
jgi:hypothetical protein